VVTRREVINDSNESEEIDVSETSETGPAKHYFAICPTTGIEIKVKLGGEPGADVSRLPVALTPDNGMAPKCLCGERHMLVETTAEAAAWLDVDSDERDYLRPGLPAEVSP
jgi:hypothetical protein